MIFTRVFDESSSIHWSQDPTANEWFVQYTINSLNERLALLGYLFLNEAYGRFGLQPSQEGLVVGWHYRLGSGDVIVNSAVDIHTKAVTLHFNVDGLISPLLQKEEDFR